MPAIAESTISYARRGEERGDRHGSLFAPSRSCDRPQVHGPRCLETLKRSAGSNSATDEGRTLSTLSVAPVADRSSSELDVREYRGRVWPFQAQGLCTLASDLTRILDGAEGPSGECSESWSRRRRGVPRNRKVRESGTRSRDAPHQLPGHGKGTLTQDSEP